MGYEEWQEYSFLDVTENLDKKRIPLSAFQRKDRNGRYPYYGAQGIIDYIDGYIFDGTYLLIAEDGENLKSNKQNVATLASGKFWVNNHAHVVKNNHLSDIKFLYYLCSETDISGYITGSAQPKLNQANLNNIRFLMPSLPEQHAIAATLSCLDDKIELNNKINANLEAQAQAIFKSWFETKESDSWDVGHLSDIAYINPRRTLRQQENATYLEMSNMPTQGCFPQGWTKQPYAGGMKFQNGDTLLARITPCLENGKAAYVNFLDENETAFGSTEYIVLAPKSGYPSEMLYFLVRDEAFINYAIKNMTGSTGRQRVSGDALGKYELLIPPAEFVKDYTSFFRTVMMTIRQNSFQNRMLSSIRDTLLPKLMSGEIEVPVND